jgi:hypothetical protein
MKKALLLLVAAVLLAGAWSTSAMAEAGKLTGDVGVDYASRYIWRGIDLISDNNPAVQPRFSLTYGITDQLSVKYLFWADYRLVSGSDRTEENDNDWDEFDHIPSLLYTLNDTWSFELGYIWYYLPSIPNTQEVYGGATMVLPKNHYTSLYVYYDFDKDNRDGVYIKWAVGGSQPITDYAKCFYSAGLGYMDYDHRNSDDYNAGFSDLPLTAGISIDLGRGLSASISYNYSFTFDALRDDGANYKNEGWLMTGLAYAF